MDRSRGRGRRRKHIEYDDVVPSTDLPPLVEGELRCFLFVTIGELVWGTTTTHKVPPASPVYIRLRWWGEASNGTYFRPQSKKLQHAVKCRAQFGIRSGPKQISAYFNDMGSATFDVLSSPTSLPIGRVLVPGVSSLSSSKPIRGYFPIMSASSRKLGELQISMSFKPLKAAYEESSDTMTDGSFSVRSRNGSVGGYGSRQSSRSRASSLASTKSRSSSRGRASRSGSNHRNVGRRSSSSRKQKKKTRSRSRSTESKASLEASRHDILTPRGIDALLERNGHNLYQLNKELPESNKENQVHIKTTVSSTQPTDTAQGVSGDAISELLKRGRALRDEINLSRAQDVPISPPRSTRTILPPELPSSSHQIPQPLISLPHTTPTTTVTTAPAPIFSSNAPPSVQKQRSHSSLKLVDMLFKGSGVRTTDIHTPDMSTVSTPPYSMVSDSDDPLHDESILQQLFYSNTLNLNDKAMQTGSKESGVAVTQAYNKTTQPLQATSSSHQPHQTRKSDSVSNQFLTDPRKLENVSVARISIHSLQLANSIEFEEDFFGKKSFSPKKKERGRLAKPPMSASQGDPQNTGRTFFVEYKFPHTVPTHKSIALTTSNHEVTRVASRKVSKNGLVKFDQHSVFNIHFNPETMSKWSTEKLDFTVYQKRPKDKKASIMGCGAVPLKQVLSNSDLFFSDHLKISPKTSDQYLNNKVYGSLKVSIELVEDSKDLPMRMSPSKKPSEVSVPVPYTLTRTIRKNTSRESTPTRDRFNASFQYRERDSPRVCLVTDESASEDNEVCPRIASSVLYLYVMLDKARNVPATKLQSGSSSGRTSPPNVYLVCRTFATEDASTTAVSWNTSCPKFGLTQVVPVKINSQLFNRLRNNYVVIEVWTKVPSDKKFSDKLLGLVKIPLQIFYQSLKDLEVARAVLKSEYPLVSVDGYQAIVDVFSGNERGQLKVLLALGTQTQVNALRKLKASEEPSQDHHLDERSELKEMEGKQGDNLNSFQINIHGLCGFKPLNTQVWGETDCFVQYRFPVQNLMRNFEDSSDETDSIDEVDQDSASMQCYRTETTLCVPNPQFNYSKQHFLRPSPSMPVHKFLLSLYSSMGKSPGGGVPFEFWSRFYYPNVRDQLLAKGTLPLAKLNAMLTMMNKKVTEQCFEVPLEYLDPKSRPRCAGDLNITIKFKNSSLSAGSKKMPCKAPLPFCKNVKLQIAILRSCGLKAAAKLKASVSTDSDLEYCAEIGVNSYVKMKTSFLPSQKPYETRCIARSFSPDYNHHFEMDCPVLSHGDNDSPTCLAAHLAAGEILLEVWHKPVVEDIEGKMISTSDVLLGRIQIPTSCLLYKTTGCSSWYPITSMESLQLKSTTTVGAVELAMSFSCRSDLDLILRAAKAVSWSPALKSDLSRLLVPSSSGVLKPVEDPDSLEDFFTTCLTVTNAWLPKKLLTFPGSEEINKHAHIYLRYKFYDKDTVVSSICPVANASERKSFKQHDVFPIKLAHRKSFLCRATQPLVWYLREEALEIQVWLSYSRSSRTRKRPFDSDKLLGTAHIDMSAVLIGGLHRQQHISNLYPLLKAGVEDMGDAAVRVYLSLSPGDHTKSYDLETLDDSTNSSTDNFLDSSKESDQTLTYENRKKKRMSSNQDFFSAVVSVERAMHLNSLPSSADEAEAHSTCYVTYPVARSSSKSVETTNAVTRSSCPVWNDAKEVILDRKLLNKESGSLLFRVWQRDECVASDKTLSSDEKSRPTNDKVIGFATVDISVLQAGFRAVNGWYNILDIHGHCQGQIKLAITPTEPLYSSNCPVADNPSESKTSSDQQNLAPKGILHSVPLFGPVKTPSGSLYYPGVAASGKERNTISSVLDDVITSLPVSTRFPQPPPASVAEATSSKTPVSVDQMPRLAMFQHDSPSALQSTLQRQMKELDEIKEAFMQKKIINFDCEPTIKTGYSSKVLNPPFSKTMETSQNPAYTPQLASSPLHHPVQIEETTVPASTSSSGSSGSSSTSSDDANDSTAGATSVPKPSGKLTFSTPDRSKPSPTVHLSLFKPEKDRISEFDGAVLSDNEMSDVEFVEPVNLNDNSGIFTSSKVPQDPEFPPDQVPQETKSTPDEFTVSPERTESSAHPSELNNTSLWLSSQTENVSSNDQAPKENKVEDDDTITPVPSPPVSEHPDQILEVENDHPVSPNDPDEPSDSLAPSDHQEALEEQDEDEVGLSDEDDHVRSGNEISPDEEVDVRETDPEHSDSLNDSKTTEELAAPDEPDESHTEEMQNGQLEEQNTEESSSDEESSSFEESASQELTHLDQVSPVILSGRDARNQPSCSYTTGSSAHQQWSSIPSFFPPSKDLLASMKTLQAITTEQKKNLLQGETTENKENSFTAAHSRPRRKLMRPATHTSEQTERLARIFSAKYN